jgi:hypothetical protein
MTSIGGEFLPRDTQKLALARNLGDALMEIAKTVWPYHTARNIEREWQVDKSTAKNVTKGVVGAAVVTKALRAQQAKHKNAWALWDALGELVIGETRAEFERRLIKRIIEQNEHAREALASLDRSALDVETRAYSLDGMGPGLAPVSRRSAGV